MDPNNGIYPLAYAVTEAESKDSWKWFLEYLRDDLELPVNANFTFISDRQKGLILALHEVYPNAEHRFCVGHIHHNFKQQWRGKAYKDMLWSIATATTVQQFQDKMEEMRLMNPDAHHYLIQIPPVHWTRSHFSGLIRGMPCTHVVATNWDMASNGLKVDIPERWVDKCYWLSTWKEVYSHKIGPINGRSMWPKSGCPLKLIEPKYHKPIGRPRKMRRKEEMEKEDSIVKNGKLSRKWKTMTCRKCGGKGHNRRKCNGQGQSSAAAH